MDHAKDADWQTYVDGAEALHLAELTALEQSAYDRSMGR